MPKRIAYDTTLSYGLGVDSSSEQARGMAVAPTQPRNLEGASGTSVIYSSHFCDSQRSLEETLGVSAAMSVSYGFVAGGSAKVDFAQSKTMTEHSLCIVVKVLVTNPVLYMADVHLIDVAKGIYSRDPEEFKARFGDLYVNGILTGGELFGVLMMTASSEEEKSALSTKTTASGQFGLWGAKLDVSVENTVNTAVQNTHVDVLVQSSGYVPPLYPGKPEDLLQLAREFPGKVRETGQGVPYAADLMEYRF